MESVAEQINDGIVAQDETQAKHMWTIRENVVTAHNSYGFTLKYDLSLRADFMYKIVEETKQKIWSSCQLSQSEKESVRAVGYGHIGDGNLHFNISIPGHQNEDL